MPIDLISLDFTEHLFKISPVETLSAKIIIIQIHVEMIYTDRSHTPYYIYILLEYSVFI